VSGADLYRGGATLHALETAEAERVIRATVAALPEAQRAVITLRDNGWRHTRGDL
jgi:DNA-directed RNA polymerase specialized sigma24 family protein